MLVWMSGFSPKVRSHTAGVPMVAAYRVGALEFRILRALVTESGEVKHIMVVQSLGYELTRRAIEAARQARFEPAKKDGIPVPVITLIEYDFKEMAAADK